ncbi:nucleoside/nucleotide kinase family protein [Peribacillus muralis]|uniref:hypothetical protein n=1 Tax=Peribacillus muralis TaxID=264697 RepID=UPI003671C3A3
MAIKLAVTGEIRSGKNAFCDYIQSMVPNMEQLYFAKGIEEIIRKYFPEAYEGNEKPRKYFQDIGQMLRTVNPEVWVNQVAEQYNWSSSESFICTDLRQPNEYEWLKSEGFTVVKIEADADIRITRMALAGDSFTPESLNHPVEQQIRNLPWDWRVINNGTLEQLHEQADIILQQLRIQEEFTQIRLKGAM